MINCTFLWATVGVALLIGCYPTRNTPATTNDLCCTAIEVTDSMYLSNRIPDCDQALRYMDSVIVPRYMSIRPNPLEYRIPQVVEGDLTIMCDSTNLYKTKKYLYYVNAKCFEGLPSKDLFKIICPHNQLEQISQIDSLKYSIGRDWRLSMSIGREFGVNFDIQNKTVVAASIWKVSYIEMH